MVVIMSEGSKIVRHTPGPWELKIPVEPYPNHFLIYGNTKHGVPLIAQVLRGTQAAAILSDKLYYTDDDENTLERKANAELIASAPNTKEQRDLLLSVVQRIIDYDIDLPTQLRQEAIAACTGKP